MSTFIKLRQGASMATNCWMVGESGEIEEIQQVSQAKLLSHWKGYVSTLK